MVVIWTVTLLLMVLAFLWWRQLEHAAVRRAWIKGMHGARNGCCDVGLSLLVADGSEMERYERLLGVEYARLEVVAVVDRERDGALFGALMARYHLIRVCYRPSGELPIYGVRGLYRSRKRRFRRLVLLDMAHLPTTIRLNAAADVASYDYLMPILVGEELRRGTVEQLVTELSLRPLGQIEQVVQAPTLRVLVWRRVALARAGGFACRFGSLVASSHRLMCWDSPFEGAGCGALRRLGLGAVVWSVVVVLGWLYDRSWHLPLVWCLALLVGLLIALRVRQLRDDSSPE